VSLRALCLTAAIFALLCWPARGEVGLGDPFAFEPLPAGSAFATALGVSDAGEAFVLMSDDRVLRYGSDGRSSASWRVPPLGPRLFQRLLTVTPDGAVFVLAPDDRVVRRFDRTGRLEVTWPVGPGPASADQRPVSLGPAPGGDVVVSFGAVLKRFARDGAFRGALAGCCFGDADFAVDRLGTTWQIDVSQDGREAPAPHLVYGLAAGGRTRAVLGAGFAPASRVGDGSFELSGGPTGVAIDAQDGLWVTDRGSGRFQRFDVRDGGVESVCAAGAGAGGSLAVGEGGRFLYALSDRVVRHPITRNFGARCRLARLRASDVVARERRRGLRSRIDVRFRMSARSRVSARLVRVVTTDCPAPAGIRACERRRLSAERSVDVRPRRRVRLGLAGVRRAGERGRWELEFSAADRRGNLASTRTLRVRR